MLENMAISHDACIKTHVGFNVGKHYNTYMPNSDDKKQTSLKLISRCRQNKILIQLDNKEVNHSGCNTEGMYGMYKYYTTNVKII